MTRIGVEVGYRNGDGTVSGSGWNGLYRTREVGVGGGGWGGGWVAQSGGWEVGDRYGRNTPVGRRFAGVQGGLRGGGTG